MSDNRTKILQILSDILEVELSFLNDNSSFIRDLGADSLHFAEIIMEIEDEFDLEFPGCDITPQTIGKMIEYTEQLIKRRMNEV